MPHSRDDRQLFRNLFYPERMRNLDIERWVEHCARQGATSVCLDIKSQIHALYPSRWLEKDPLIGERDYAAELAAAARRHGLAWCAYIAPYQQEELRDSHRAWQQRLEDGTVLAEAGTGFLKTQFCWSTPYRELLCNVLREIAERYRPDAFYIDGLRFQRQQNRLTCYCTACRARFRDEQGLDLPLSTAPDSAESRHAWRLFLAARARWAGEAAAALRAAVDAADPDIVLYLNNKFGSDDWASSEGPAQFRGFVPCREVIPQCVRGSLPHAPYGFSAGDLFLWECAAQRAAAHGRPGQLYLSLSPVMRAEDIRLSLDLAAAAGALVSIQERRTDTPAMLARLKAVAPWLSPDAVPLAEVAIHYSRAAQRAATPACGGTPFRNDAAGLYKMALDLHRPAELVLDEDLAAGDFRGAPLVVLPESDRLGAAARGKLLAFLEDGGAVLAALAAGTLDESDHTANGGELLAPGTGLFPGEPIRTRRPFGLRREDDGRFVREESVTADPAQYLVFHKGAPRDWLGEDPAIGDHPGNFEDRELFALRDTPSVYLPVPALRVRADEPWTVLASVRFRDDRSGAWEASPAVLSRTVGRGTLLYTAFAPGSLFRERSLWCDIGYAWSRHLVAHLLDLAAGPSHFRIEAPACVKAAFWRSGRRTLLHLVNELSGHAPAIPLEERLPVRGRIRISATQFSAVQVLFGEGQGCRVTKSPRGWSISFRALKDRLLLLLDASDASG